MTPNKIIYQCKCSLITFNLKKDQIIPIGFICQNCGDAELVYSNVKSLEDE